LETQHAGAGHERRERIGQRDAAAAGGRLARTVALRVTPGSLGELDVRGAQRVVLPMVPATGKPVDLELPPGVYPPKTAEVTVAWGPAPAT